MDKSNGKGKVFRGGIPYGPDVRRLYNAFPVDSLDEGRVITHEELSEVLKCTPPSQRYYAVVNSWKNDLERSYGVTSTLERGIGVRLTFPHENLLDSEKQIRKGMTITIRGVRRLINVDRSRLDNDGQRRYDHEVRVATRFETAIYQTRKELPIDVPAITSLPKRMCDTNVTP